jgi:uncharacterized membrane protein YgaE (UPF0421/DUF939 family)
MKRFLSKQPYDFRYCVSIGLAIGMSQSVYRASADRFGIVAGLLATAAAGALVALLVSLILPAPKKVSREALAAVK